MRVLALDPSIVKTGWAAYGDPHETGADPWCFASGVIRPEGEGDAARLVDLVESLERLPADLDDDALVVIEQAPDFTYARSQRFGKTLNASAQRKLNTATGAVLGWAVMRGYRVRLVPATTWKGRAPKWVNQAVTGTRSSDEADAIALGSWWVRIGHTLTQEGPR